MEIMDKKQVMQRLRQVQVRAQEINCCIRIQPKKTQTLPTQIPGRCSPNAGNTKDAGGPNGSCPESVVARNFNEALVNSPTDLIGIDFTIWGDPYIADSGMGNYPALPATFNMTTDGTMNYPKRRS